MPNFAERRRLLCATVLQAHPGDPSFVLAAARAAESGLKQGGQHMKLLLLPSVICEIVQVESLWESYLTCRSSLDYQLAPFSPP